MLFGLILGIDDELNMNDEKQPFMAPHRGDSAQRKYL